MRRKDKEIIDQKVMVSIIKRSSVCRVAMCWQDEPYIIPMNFDYSENYLYFIIPKMFWKKQLLLK